ncbi:MAG: hypothetical protein NZ853_01025 [Leptospiraceae bacterium]|nr:hypothetical protein [Leptospiraceae bacterium]MDW7976189.1 hypothetical protein [Leptospiraceae bacterium]
MKIKALQILIIFSLGTTLVAQQPVQPGQAQPQEAPAFPGPYEPTPGELITEEIDEAQLTDEQKRIRARNLRSEELWKNADYRDYDPSFTELYKLSKAFANNKYRLALSAFQAGVNSIIKMREEEELFRKKSAETRRFNEKWYWQVVDRKAQEERQIYQMKLKAKQDAVTYFTRAINHLDEILNPELREKEPFKRLLSAVYRNWVIYQYDLGNIPQTIPILEHYIQIDDNEKEYPAHKYLSQAYAFQEKMIIKYGMGTEDQMLRYRYKKNVHLLRATELKYGKESAEYRHVVSLVNRDEIISVMP